MAALASSSLMTARVAPSSRQVVARAERSLWLPCSPAPAYLDGSMPGTYSHNTAAVVPISPPTPCITKIGESSGRALAWTSTCPAIRARA